MPLSRVARFGVLGKQRGRESPQLVRLGAKKAMHEPGGVDAADDAAQKDWCQ